MIKLTLLFLLLLPSLTIFASDKCFKENDTVTISGALSLTPFFGPPGYGEAGGRGDKKLHAWILKTADAICVKNSEGKKDDAEFQLIIPMEDLKVAKKLVGKTITVTGSLMEWQTGYHIRPFLIDVKQFTSENKL